MKHILLFLVMIFPLQMLPAENVPAPEVTSEKISNNIYSSPGIVTLQNGQWVGNEHLYNLSKDIGLVVEIIKPAGKPLPITEESIQNQVMPILKQAGIAPRSIMMVTQSPLPFLRILIMVTPIEKGYAAYCAGGLLEEVQLKRIFLKTGIVWQAVTWEKQELIVFPTEQLEEQINKAVQNIATAFAERFKSYPK